MSSSEPFTLALKDLSFKGIVLACIQFFFLMIVFFIILLSNQNLYLLIFVLGSDNFQSGNLYQDYNLRQKNLFGKSKCCIQKVTVVTPSSFFVILLLLKISVTRCYYFSMLSPFWKQAEYKCHFKIYCNEGAFRVWKQKKLLKEKLSQHSNLKT